MNQTITAGIDLDKLEALARAATPGEWKWDGRKQDEDGYVYIPECSYLVGGISLAYQHMRHAQWFKAGFAKTEADASSFHYGGELLDQLVDAAIEAHTKARKEEA